MTRELTQTLRRNQTIDWQKKETARAGIDELERFIREIGLPATLQELGIHGDVDLKAVADSCAVVPGSYRKLTQEEIFEIFKECF